MIVGDIYFGKTGTRYKVMKVTDTHITVQSDYTTNQRYEMPKVTTMPIGMFHDLFPPNTKESPHDEVRSGSSQNT